MRSLAPALVLALVVCAGSARAQAPARTAPARPAGTPAEAVEQFMQLATANSYVQMGYVFGTHEGPIIRRDPEPQVERRMYAIANILKNERFVIRSQAPIPGRASTEAMQLTVQLTQNGQRKDVPFVVVHTNNGAWLVEQVDLERLTRWQ
jgi:hypothetical protein